MSNVVAFRKCIVTYMSKETRTCLNQISVFIFSQEKLLSVFLLYKGDAQ